jgi:8-oxo-dGTP pyrophosphatase MutT (NUDIX family)
MQNEVLRQMLSRLNPSQPPIESKKLAAVSVIVADEAKPKTLLIRRAEHSDDPWSGQVAFPGGKTGSDDKSARDTAVRETKEEVSIDLAKEARFAGYFVPFRTHTSSMDVIPVVFLLEREVEVTPNLEVSSYKWVGLDEFLQPRSASIHELQFKGFTREMPAFTLGDYVIWGLTHRIISSLLGVVVP